MMIAGLLSYRLRTAFAFALADTFCTCGYFLHCVCNDLCWRETLVIQLMPQARIIAICANWIEHAIHQWKLIAYSATKRALKIFATRTHCACEYFLPTYLAKRTYCACESNGYLNPRMRLMTSATRTAIRECGSGYQCANRDLVRAAAAKHEQCSIAQNNARAQNYCVRWGCGRVSCYVSTC